MPFWMILSALLFGYFGFMQGMTATTVNGQFVLFFAILLWTLRGLAVLYGLSVVITLVQARAGNLLYALTGAVGAVLLGIVLVMDVLDDQRAAAISPLFLGFFAAWNGYNSWTSLRDLMVAPRRDAP